MKQSETWNPPARLPIYEAIANDLRAVLAKRELNTKIETSEISNDYIIQKKDDVIKERKKSIIKIPETLYVHN
jgi:hypothetical protein